MGGENLYENQIDGLLMKMNAKYKGTHLVWNLYYSWFPVGLCRLYNIDLMPDSSVLNLRFETLGLPSL